MGYLTREFNQIDPDDDLVFIPERNRPRFVDTSRPGSSPEKKRLANLFDAFRKKRAEGELAVTEGEHPLTMATEPPAVSSKDYDQFCQ